MPPVPRVPLLLLAFIATWNISAEVLEHSPKTWQLEDGLPHASVQAIAQTPDGYLWVGTWKGLARFDGLSFTPAEDVVAADLKNISVTSLYASRNGTLWIGTANEGIVCIASNQLSRIAVPSLTEAPNNQVLGLFEDESSTMWVATRDGLLQCRNGGLSWVDAVPKTTLRNICPGDGGELWLGSSAGLLRFKEKVLQRFTHTNGLPNSVVRAVCLDRDGTLWAGSNQGLTRLRNKKLTHYSKKDGLSDMTVSSLYQDRYGTIWIGTFGGLNRLVDGKITVELASSGFPYDVILCFYEDMEGNLWIGAKDGLHRLNRKRFKTITTQQGLSHNNVMSVTEDRHGAIWAGTWGGGLQRIEKDRITVFTSHRTNQLRSELILGIHETAGGNLWIGADYDAGFFQFKDGRFLRFGNDMRFTGHAVRVICSDQETNLWVGTSAGLFEVKGSKYKVFKKQDGLPDDVVRSLLLSRDKTLWIGTAQGLAKRTTSGFSILQPDNPLLATTINALHEEPDGTLWLGTLGRGLIRYQNGNLTQFSIEDGLFSDEIFEIVDDDLGSFWMTSLRGIFRVSKEDLANAALVPGSRIQCVSYATHDGLMTVQCNGVAKPSACKSRDGRLWFATTKGIAVIDPKIHSRKNERTPTVVIEKLVSNKKLIRVSPATPAIKIEPGRGELEVHYTALSLQAPEKNQFRYKLDGIDADWSDAATRRVAYYSKIPPGKYVFRVKASNNDSVWNDSGARLAIVMLPHFWQTWWFRSSLGMAACAMLGFAYHVRVSRLRALDRLRLRIAADLHDDVGASLTKIAMLAEMAERETPESISLKAQLREIAQTNRGVIQAMEEIVWTIKPKNDTVDGLVNFLVRYSQKYFRNTPIRCRLDVPADLPNQPISPDARHNLFLALKEALNNVAKHSGATEVSIQIAVLKAHLKLVITDNGVGFKNTKAVRDGNGLANMERRLQELGGRFFINTAPGKGTEITLEMPSH